MVLREIQRSYKRLEVSWLLWLCISFLIHAFFVFIKSLNNFVHLWTYKNRALTMWTFLGIASFIYVYKKCGDLLSYANKEMLISTLVFFSLGLMLSYWYRSWGPQPQNKQQPHCGMFSNFLAALPFVGFFWTKSHADSTEKLQPKIKRVCYFIWIV